MFLPSLWGPPSLFQCLSRSHTELGSSLLSSVVLGPQDPWLQFTREQLLLINLQPVHAKPQLPASVAGAGQASLLCVGRRGETSRDPPHPVLGPACSAGCGEKIATLCFLT